MRGALFWVIVYAGAVLAAPVLAAIYGVSGGKGLVYEIGRSFGLAAAVILALQVLPTGRFKWIEKPFGLDMLVRFHKHMAVFAVGLVGAHFFLLAAGGAGWGLLFSLDLPWYIWLGKAGFLALLTSAAISLYRRRFLLKFEAWRKVHGFLAAGMLILVFVHSYTAGADLAVAPLKQVWQFLFAAALILLMYHRLIRPRFLEASSYEVAEVVPETRDVWTVKLKPRRGGDAFNYLPGQFQFLTFQRGRDLPVEEHHWTISSSPGQKDFVSSTIKAVGDFTATIGKTRPGDTAIVHAPFGRFSYLLHKHEKDLVFVAGGIGITPLMSMIRHMRDTESPLPVTLIYANRTRADIVFAKELEKIQAGRYPNLNVVHVLSRPDDQWQGETGHVSMELLKKHCGPDLSGKAFYLCGPPGMTEAVVAGLKKSGVKDGQMHLELFRLLD